MIGQHCTDGIFYRPRVSSVAMAVEHRARTTALEALTQLVGTLRRKGLYCTEAIEALQRAARIAAPAEYHTALRSALNDQLATEAGRWARNVVADGGGAAAAAGGRGGKK